MKSENYDELMDKFYAGKASAEDISILIGKGLLDDQDIFYTDALNSEREQKMDWDFEDLMNEVSATKVVALPRRNLRMKRMIAAAAVVATFLVAWFFWQKQDNPGQIVQAPVINKKVDTGMEISAKPALPGNKAKDPIVLSEDVKIYPRAIKNYTVKTSKHNFSKSNNPVAKDKEETTARNDDFIVMVNGKRITDEADAIAITKQSLSMVSRDLTNTVNGLKPIGR